MYKGQIIALVSAPIRTPENSEELDTQSLIRQYIESGMGFLAASRLARQEMADFKARQIARQN